MQEDLDAFYEVLGYDEGSDPSEVRLLIQRKKFIDTHDNMVAAYTLKIKDIFCKDRYSSPHWIFLQIYHVFAIRS